MAKFIENQFNRNFYDKLHHGNVKYKLEETGKERQRERERERRERKFTAKRVILEHRIILLSD